MRLLLCFLLAAATGCDTNSRAVAIVLDAGCTPMPTECPAQAQCEVTTVGEQRVCSGSACCQSFCAVNGCGTCCASAAPSPAP